MKGLMITDAGTGDIPLIQNLAEKTWWDAYRNILTEGQIQYMLDTLYHQDALKNAMETQSQHFIVLSKDGSPVGFAAYSLPPEAAKVCKLHKLYVLPECHGKGHGKTLIEFVKSRALETGCTLLELNVNRHNPARYFYERLGFRIAREEDIPIGPYWMNDYVMQFHLSSHEKGM